jgi:hypothetical protein
MVIYDTRSIREPSILKCLKCVKTYETRGTRAWHSADDFEENSPDFFQKEGNRK